MVIKVGINGFGRVGRVVLRTCLQHPELQIAAINDPAIEVEYICYLIKFDSTHGKISGDITHTDNEVKINDVVIKVLHHKVPSNIPWQVAGVQYVVEASGMFTSFEKASGHLASDGVKRVIVTAPSVDVPIIILGVNENKLFSEHKVMSCGSSTLYCLAPIVKILEDSFGIEDGFITSIHAMTPSLKPLDGLCLRGKHWRDHRSIHQNIIPATTGACKALGKIIPQVKDKMTGLAFRVPIVNVSVLDLTIRLKKETTVEDIAQKVERASKSSMQNIIKISDEETVSSDFIGDKCSCILDVNSSLQVRPEFFKLVCWYENEYSYACRVVDSIFFSEKQLEHLELKSKMTYVRPRLFKKQDMVQQTDLCLKVTSEIKYEAPNIPYSFSQSDKKAAPNVLCIRKTFAPINTRFVQPSDTVGDTNKKSDIFKICNNDDKQMVNPCMRQHRNSFFQSQYQNTGQTDGEMGIKPQDRLEKVKKEFSKMVDITENLLRKSYSKKKQEIDKACITDMVANCKEVIKKLNDSILESSKHEQTNCKMSVASGDGKPSASTINSKMYNDCSKEDVDSNTSYEINNSDYGANEIKKPFMTKIDYLSLSCTRVTPKVIAKVQKQNAEVSLSKPFVPDNLYSLTSCMPKLEVSKTDKCEAAKISKGSIQTVFNNKNQDLFEPSNIKIFKEDVIKTKKQVLTLEPFNTKHFKEHAIKTVKQDIILMPSNTKTVKEHVPMTTKQHLTLEPSDNNNLKGNITKTFKSLVDGLSKTVQFQSFSGENNYLETLNEAKPKDEESEKKEYVQILPSSVEKTAPEDINCDVEKLSDAQSSSAFRPQSTIKEIVCAETITHDADVKEDILKIKKKCQDEEIVKLNSSNYDDSTTHTEDLNLQKFEVIEVENQIAEDFIKITDDEICNKENLKKITNKINVIDDELRKRNIVIIKDKIEKRDKQDNVFFMDDSKTKIHECKQLLESQKEYSKSTQRFVFNALANDFISRNTSNGDVNLRKQDIYDKLDSASATDSDTSILIDKKKSQVIQITDLTTSLDDLERLDKICRIIEISDELSDKLFSALDRRDDRATGAKKQWSFKDLCEKIKLDDFCNKIFK